jgi:ribosomal protein S9
MSVFHAVGRRKKAVARVRLVPGEGNIVINRRDIDNYFGLETLKMTVRQPLNLTNLVPFVTASAVPCAKPILSSVAALKRLGS